MGLFDLFGKKRKVDNTPPAENELEKALKSAAANVSARKTFYRFLLDSELFLITHEEKQQESGIAQAGEMIAPIHLNDGSVPLFTSQQRIFDKDVIKEQVYFIKAKGSDLLNLLKSARIILNPFSDYSKELIPDEIASMLDGSIFNDHNEIVLNVDTQVLIGEPAVYPTEFIENVINVLKKHDAVTRAYLAFVKYPDKQLPNYLVALDAGEHQREIATVLGPLVLKYLPDQAVDFTGTDTFNYFHDKEPFYKNESK